MAQRSKGLIALALFANALVAAPSLAQTQSPAQAPSPCSVDFNAAYLKSYYHDSKTVLAKPLHWDTQDWLTVAGFFSAAAGLYWADQEIQNWSQRNRSEISARLTGYTDGLGSAAKLWIPTGSFLLAGELFGSQKATRVGLLILESQIITGVIGQVIRFGAGRTRPREFYNPRDWRGAQLPPYLSFPSGHAHTAFALATVIAMEYPDTPLVPTLSYAVATITALGRMFDNAHWSSDLFIGAALGYFVARTVVQNHTCNDAIENRLSFRTGSNGITIEVHF